MQATSAESNVLSIPAALGLKTKVLTTFVKDSPIAKFIQGDLRRRGIDYEGAEVPQGGPWGYRHQFNIADSGFGHARPARGQRPRGRSRPHAECEGFRLNRLSWKRAWRSCTFPGLSPRFRPETSEFCLALAARPRRRARRISFDLNYRESFWKGREAELRAAFTEIASLRIS